MRQVVRAVAGMLAVAVVSVVAGCGGSNTAASSAGDTLRFALADTPAPLDPDTYYEAQGTVITQAVYEGLLQYQPDSAELEGLLATDWSVSRDGRTYRFTLRQGVEFSDGTPFDAAAAKASLERRTAVEGGPSYMLADVADIQAPDEHTLVVRLKRPNAAFLDLLASPFGPMMISPKAIAEHEKDGDHAGAWLATHSAGTGPYVLSDVQRGVRYTLTANPRYWGDQPGFKTVDISIVPDAESQRLQLEGGSLDLILSGLTTRDVKALEGTGKVDVHHFPALQKAAVWINLSSPVFGAADVRAALRAALDREELTAEIYGERARPSEDVYPAGMLPEGAAPDEAQHDPSLLPEALEQHRGEKVVIGWWADAAMRDLANLLQVRLHDLGVDASVRQYSAAEILAMPTKPDLRPDLLAVALNPDAAAPDTWSRVYWREGAPVNILGCTVPEADRLLDRAVQEPDPERSRALGAQAARAYGASDCWINVADVFDTIVVRRGITGAEHQLPWLGAVRLASLEPGTPAE